MGVVTYTKLTLATQGKDDKKTENITAHSSHLPIVMGKKGMCLVLRCSSAVMAPSRDKHMLWPSSDSSTYSLLSGLRPLSPTSPFTVYDFPLFSTTRTSSDVLWVFAPAQHVCMRHYILTQELLPQWDHMFRHTHLTHHHKSKLPGLRWESSPSA